MLTNSSKVYIFSWSLIAGNIFDRGMLLMKCHSTVVSIKFTWWWRVYVKGSSCNTKLNLCKWKPRLELSMTINYPWCDRLKKKKKKKTSTFPRECKRQRCKIQKVIIRLTNLIMKKVTVLHVFSNYTNLIGYSICSLLLMTKYPSCFNKVEITVALYKITSEKVLMSLKF